MVWWCMQEKWGQEDKKFKVIPGYIASLGASRDYMEPHLKKNEKKIHTFNT